jgi:hypothetical protein
VISEEVRDEVVKLDAVPTVFEEQLYRSRLEARAALWLVSHEVDFEYEPWRTESGYLPDFVLPEQKVIFECKGAMTARDKETLQRAAVDAGRAGWQLFTWMGYSWQRIKGGDKFRCVDRHESQAFLCANCLTWTWRHECESCGSYGAYLAEHPGRVDEIKIPTRQMGTLVCDVGTRDGLRLEEVDVLDPDVSLPEGFDPKEHDRIQELITEPQPCRYFEDETTPEVVGTTSPEPAGVVLRTVASEE